MGQSPNQSMKVLILRFSSIGDIVLTTPVLRCIKQQLPSIELHYCTKKAYRSVLAANPYVDKIICLEDRLSALIKKLKAEQYDFVIDLHHNLRTQWIKWRLGVKASSFNKLTIEKWLMVNFKINVLPRQHIVDRYMAAVAFLGVQNDGQGLDYFIPATEEVSLTWLPSTHQKAFVAYAIGGQHATKRLPVHRMIQLCDRINKPIVLLGGEEDYAVGEAIAAFFQRSADHAPYEAGLQKLNKKCVIFNACGKLNLHQSASLVKQAQVVFSHDTGLMHIAAAFKKHIYTIWGNTIPAFGMYPYQTKFILLENNKLSCRPCSKIGFDRCPKGHFKCMNDITFDFSLA